VADYALTELASSRLVADHLATGRSPVRWPGYGHAPADAMRRTLAELSSSCGSLRGYATAILSVNDSLVDALRHQLLTG
jgi:protein-tyrosine phosphatase